MQLRCIFLVTLFTAVSTFALDNYDTLTHSVIRCIVNRDSAGLAALIQGKTFRYFMADIRSDKKLLRDTKNFMVRPDGFYPYEKKLRKFAPKDAALFLVPGSADSSQARVAESDFSQVNIEGKCRVEIVCRELRGMEGVHLVFVKNTKMMWGFAGAWWEKVRTE
jgi:hypothetical protein